jgi:hypothetical protein
MAAKKKAGPSVRAGLFVKVTRKSGKKAV